MSRMDWVSCHPVFSFCFYQLIIATYSDKIDSGRYVVSELILFRYDSNIMSMEHLFASVSVVLTISIICGIIELYNINGGKKLMPEYFHTYRFEAWVHPKSGGDDKQVELEIDAPSLESAKAAVEGWLRKRSCKTDDYRLMPS